MNHDFPENIITGQGEMKPDYAMVVLENHLGHQEPNELWRGTFAEYKTLGREGAQDIFEAKAHGSGVMHESHDIVVRPDDGKRYIAVQLLTL